MHSDCAPRSGRRSRLWMVPSHNDSCVLYVCGESCARGRTGACVQALSVHNSISLCCVSRIIVYRSFPKNVRGSAYCILYEVCACADRMCPPPARKRKRPQRPRPAGERARFSVRRFDRAVKAHFIYPRCELCIHARSRGSRKQPIASHLMLLIQSPMIGQPWPVLRTPEYCSK